MYSSLILNSIRIFFVISFFVDVQLYVTYKRVTYKRKYSRVSDREHVNKYIYI